MNGRNYIKVSFTGDLMCLKEQNEAICRNNTDYREIFKEVKTILCDSDLLIGNLETPICCSPLSNESISFNTPKEFAEACLDCGVGFVSTANNHCLDRGISGLIETIGNLDAIGIAHSGTYRTKEESEEIYFTELHGIRIGIVCATFGTNSEVNGVMLPAEETWRIDLLKRQNKPARIRFNPDSNSGKKMIADNVTAAAIGNSLNAPYVERYLKKIEKAKEGADIVFVIPHVGGQYNPYPGTYTRHIVGVTASIRPSYIICGHPHVPHYVASVDGTPVAYSLGNFCFTPDVGYFIPNSLAEYGIVLHTYWDKDSKGLIKNSFTIVKNVVGEDGISRVYPVSELINILTSPIEKERLMVEVQAVANRVASIFVNNIFDQEIELIKIPQHM